jgi:hypothetical protein
MGFASCLTVLATWSQATAMVSVGLRYGCCGQCNNSFLLLLCEMLFQHHKSQTVSTTGFACCLTVSATGLQAAIVYNLQFKLFQQLYIFLSMAKYESNVKLHVKQIKHIAKRRNVIYLWKNRLR